MFSGSAVEPKQLKDIKISKRPLPEGKQKRNEFGPLREGPNKFKPPSIQSILKLRQGIFNATSHNGMVPAGTSIMTSKLFGGPTQNPAPVIPHLPDVLTEDDPRIQPARVVSATRKIMSIADIPFQPPFHIEKADLQLSYEEREQIELETKGQEDTLEWYQQRCGCLTASNFCDYRRFIEGARISESRMIKMALGERCKYMTRPTCPNQASLKWGHSNEDKARAK